MWDWISSVPDLVSLLFGGSVISIVTWKFARRKAAADAKKAEAEAKQAEAEARRAEAEAMKEKQDYYQQMADDIAKDRDYYKAERDEYRQTIRSYNERMDDLERKVARNGRMVENMRPFMCADLSCKLRKRVHLSDDGEVKRRSTQQTKNDIEPIANNEL